MSVGYHFPPDYSQQWDGFNDSGIEHFSGSPFEHLGREIIQNVLDAHKTYPVKVTIDLKEIDIEEIPNLEEIKATIDKCLVAAKSEGKKAEQFFEKAKAELEKPTIKILQIADFNTRGVEGPCELGTPYFALMKAKGQSRKTTDTAAGSYGIGKFAPFTVSTLRTVFLTTIWQEKHSKEWQQYIQGKSILMSHKSGGDTRRATGFWGVKDECMPVTGFDLDVPNWLVRASEIDDKIEEKLGATITVLGFHEIDNWEHILTANIVENFYGAIHRKELEVYIQGNAVKINSDTLPSIFDDQNIVEILQDADVSNEPDRFNYARAYYSALKNADDVIVERTENRILGHCELRILLGENLPKKIAFLRNGMMITDRFRGLIRLQEFKDFVGVLECLNPEGLALLRDMEPPCHDEFTPERLLTEEDQKKGKAALKSLAIWAKDMLRKNALEPVNDITTLDELAEFFPDDQGDDGDNRTDEQNPQGEIIIRARPLPPKKRRKVPQQNNPSDSEGDLSTGDQGPNGNQDSSNSGGDPTGGPSPEGENQGSESDKNIPVPLELRNVRAIPTGNASRKLIFTPELTGNAFIEVQDSGADTNYHLNIIASDLGIVREGKISNLPVKAGERCVVEVNFEKEFDGTVRILAHAI